MADSQVPEKTVTLTDNSTGKSVTLPVSAGTIGPEVIDIRKQKNFFESKVTEYQNAGALDDDF